MRALCDLMGAALAWVDWGLTQSAGGVRRCFDDGWSALPGAVFCAVALGATLASALSARKRLRALARHPKDAKQRPGVWAGFVQVVGAFAVAAVAAVCAALLMGFAWHLVVPTPLYDAQQASAALAEGTQIGSAAADWIGDRAAGAWGAFTGSDAGHAARGFVAARRGLLVAAAAGAAALLPIGYLVGKRWVARPPLQRALSLGGLVVVLGLGVGLAVALAGASTGSAPPAAPAPARRVASPPG